MQRACLLLRRSVCLSVKRDTYWILLCGVWGSRGDHHHGAKAAPKMVSVYAMRTMHPLPKYFSAERPWLGPATTAIQQV